MRIVWSSEAAQGIIRQMREAEQNLNECLMNARNAQAALQEANADGEDRMLNRMLDALESDIAEMENAWDEMKRLVRKTKEAKERFEEAEQKVSNLIDRVENGEGSGEIEGFDPGSLIPDFGTGLIPWAIPRPIVMPAVYPFSDGYIIREPEWLLKLIMNPDIFDLLG